MMLNAKHVMVVIVIIIERESRAAFSSEFRIDKENGESGRYIVSSDLNYMCHYGIASLLHSSSAFSEQCYQQNKNRLTEREKSNRTYPYFDSSVGTPPGCGPLPVVDDGEWVCPDGVSPLAVPVYESCRIHCKGNSLQTQTLVKVRCTEKLEWDHALLSAICSVRNSSSGLPGQDPDTLNVLIISVLVSVVTVLIVLCVFRKLRRIKCSHLQKMFGNSVFPDNPIPLDTVYTADVENDPQRNVIEGTANSQLSTSKDNVEKEQNTLNDNEINLCVSRETDLTNELVDTDITQQTISNNLTVSHTTFRRADSTVKSDFVPNNSTIKCDCVLSIVNHDAGKIELSNDFDGVDGPLHTTGSLESVNEKVANVEGHSWKQSGATSAGSCPTIAAMLEGAVDDSIRFVDDLSTLLDPDNPRNWQDLVQSYFNLSFNKIKEIRHKTKDHFKEAVLPLLSSHGFSICHLTYYFYKLPSRRIDVIECIQRYHPYCRDCGEIYSCARRCHSQLSRTKFHHYY